MDEAKNVAAVAAAAGLFHVIGDRGKTAAVVYCKGANSVQCTVYTVHCTVYSVQCTMYTVRCTELHCTRDYGLYVALH